MEDKKITKSGKEEVHFGVNSLDGFSSASVDDVDDVLKNLGEMKLWRCTTCNDLHIGLDFPKECPTCHSLDAYVEIDEKEFRAVLGALSPSASNMHDPTGPDDSGEPNG